MERAPLRPVPSRPAGPVNPATAMREVGAWVPTLPPLAAEALALVVLSERPRTEVAGSLGVSEEELAKLLAAARKELRQTVVTLGGSGWCERAEGLISDRLDGILAGRDTRRLDVHLRNCPRCVEHERRLVQATDALVGRVSSATRGPAPAGEAVPLAEAAPPDDGGEEGVPPAETAPPDDSTEEGVPAAEAAAADNGVEEDIPPAEAAAADNGVEDNVPPAEAAAADNGVEDNVPQAEAAAADNGVEDNVPPAEAAPPDDGSEGGPEIGTEDSPAISAPPEAAPGQAAPAETLPAETAAEAAPPEIPPAEAAPTREEVAAAAEAPVAPRTRRQVAAALVWNSLIGLAILLTLATIALTIAGILGARL